MNYFRQMNKQSLLNWIMLLSFSLLCAQGIGLHVHSMDHETDSHMAETAHIENISHIPHQDAQVSKPHLSLDASHLEHHGDISSAIDISPDGLFKNTQSNLIAIDFIAFVFILMILTPVLLIMRRTQKSPLKLHNFYVLSPPLRAPPLF